MERYKLVLGGTVAGVAGVLAFPTKGHTHLTIPSTSAAASSSASSAAAKSSTSSAAPASSSASSSASSTPASTAPPATAATTRSATSADESYPYGDLAVTVTVKGTTITNVKLAGINETDNRSVQIDQYAVPRLERQVLSANSVNIDGVSGATYTSQAFVNGVANALQKLGISS